MGLQGQTKGSTLRNAISYKAAGLCLQSMNTKHNWLPKSANQAFGWKFLSLSDTRYLGHLFFVPQGPKIEDLNIREWLAVTHKSMAIITATVSVGGPQTALR